MIAISSANDRLLKIVDLLLPKSTSYEFYGALQQIAGATHGVYQYISGRNVLKVTIVSDAHVEVTVFEPIGDGFYEPITSYDEFSIVDARKYIQTDRWK